MKEPTILIGLPQLRAQKELSTMMLFKRTLVILSSALIFATSGCAAMATY